MNGFERSVLIFLAALVLTIPACGNPLENSTTDGGSFTPQPLGMDYCFDCHNVPGSTRGFEQVFSQWVVSRHSNFDYYDTTSESGTPVDPYNLGGYAYSDIEGYPSYYANTSVYPTSCSPCHMGPDDGGQILMANTGGAIFGDPNLGEQYRFIIDCEACHVSGAGHFGGASPPEVPIPAFPQCTGCHPPTDPMLALAVFADAEHTDHHGPDSTRMWAYGDTVIYDIVGRTGPSPIDTTTRVLASNSFDAYVISAAWLAANGGSWTFDSNETINDTHYQGIWITDVPNELVVYDVPTAKFGYVDLTNTSPNSGMVRADSVDSCTASCHGAHEFDLTINEQWFEGAHHPNLQGPLGTNSRGITVGGPPNWGAVDHGFGEDCLRCHTSMGFAEIAPGYGGAVLTPAGKSDGFITCNACHDGVNYPTPDNRSLRFSGSIALYDYQGVPLANVQAGSSAVCVYCHQGREDSSHVDADIAAGKPVFRNMHYLAAGATLYGMKGYEYPGRTYSGEHTFHVLAGCAGCHMAVDDPPINTVGGHTFHMTDGSAENTALCTSSCHPTMNALDDPVEFAHGADWDGNGGTVSAKDEVAYLLTVLLHNAIEAYDSPDDMDTLPNINYSSGYPYFGTNSAQAWDGVVAKAVFNWQFIFEDPGAYAHNPKYAIQLLRDSYNDLAYAQSLAGAPPIPALGGTRP